MKLKKISKLILLNVLLISASSAFAAGNHTGYIDRYNVNSTINGRGACFTMLPAARGTMWNCIYKNNPLYDEISTLALSAQTNNQKCTMYWSFNDSLGHKIVNILDCSS